MEGRKRVLLTQPDDDSSSVSSSNREVSVPNQRGYAESIDNVAQRRGSDGWAVEESFPKAFDYTQDQAGDTLSTSTTSEGRSYDRLDVSSDQKRIKSSYTEDLQKVAEENEVEDEEEDDDDGSMFMDGVSDNDYSDDDSSVREIRDSDYDTDLEMDDSKWLYPEKYEIDSTGRMKYIQACKDMGLQPNRYFIRHMQDDHLRMRHRGLGPAAMKALAAPLEVNMTIETMDLAGNWIMAEGTHHLCRVLRENVFVTELNLSENKIENEGIMSVCNLLIANRTIEKLELAGNNITDQAGEKFHELLTQSNSTLKHLNLRYNKLEDGAAQWFKDALLENEALEFLDLSWNNFQSKGCVLLAEGLKENVGLKELAVAMNGFGLEGGKALGEAIETNRTLLRLNASYCRLPVECASHLAHGLSHNDNLNMLDVSYNCLKAEGVLALLHGIEKNDSSTLLLLNLGNTRVTMKFKDLHEKLKAERSLEVLHGGVLKDYKSAALEIDPMEAFKRDPMTKLKEWVERAGYRLIDLLRHFDRDQSMSISIEEFRKGIESTKIPITEEQLQLLVARLDQDGDGEIDYRELIEGDKDHRKTKREIDRYLMEKEEESQRMEQSYFS